MRNPLLFSFAAACFASITACSEPPAQPRLASHVAPHCPPATDDGYYLALDAVPRASAYLRDFYSQYLKAAGVQPLWCGQVPAKDAQRLLWFPPNGQALIIDAVEAGDGWQVTVFRFGGPRRGEADTALAGVQRAVHSLSEGEALLAALEREEVWTIPPPLQAQVMDGTRWVVEMRTGDAYRLLTGNTADPGALSEIPRIFFAFAELELPEDLKPLQR